MIIKNDEKAKKLFIEIDYSKAVKKTVTSKGKEIIIVDSLGYFPASMAGYNLPRHKLACSLIYELGASGATASAGQSLNYLS